MTVVQGFILGAIQGVTEFLPISSSAHLVLVPWVLGWQLDREFAFVFDVLIQTGTLLAVVAVHARRLAGMGRAVWAGLRSRRPLADPEARLAWLVLLATVPAVAAGAVLHDVVEATFASPMAASGFLLVTASLLLLSEWIGRPRRHLTALGWVDALIVGTAQAFALFPGISRSGSTIAAGLARGLHRTEAARLSFLMVIPVMAGAGLVALRDLAQVPLGPESVAALAVGFLTATVVGYLAIRWLLAYLASHRLIPFAIYCLILGGAGIVFNWVRM